MMQSFPLPWILEAREPDPLSDFESQKEEQAKSALDGVEQRTDDKEEGEQARDSHLEEGGQAEGDASDMEQATRELPSLPGLLQAQEYLSVREAALLMGVSARSVYGYIEAGKLQGIRIGASIAVHADAVRKYERQVVGRPRTRTPVWRVPTPMNQEYLTSIEVRLRDGQEEAFEEHMRQVQKQQKHVLPGSVARFISQDEADRRQVQILLFWRRLVLPSPEELSTALNAFCDDLADLCEWETAVWRKSKIVLSTY